MFLYGKMVYWIDIKNMTYEIIYYGYFLVVSKKPGNIVLFVTSPNFQNIVDWNTEVFPWWEKMLSNQKKNMENKNEQLMK